MDFSARYDRASDLLADLRRTGSAWDTNWEVVLTAQYGTVLRPGYLGVDIGANLGEHTRGMLDHGAGSVVSFEPIPSLAAGLRELGDRVTVHEMALSDQAGSATFYVHGAALSESGLAVKVSKTRADYTTIEVVVGRLDDVPLGGLPAFIKLDCEGAEIAALSGGDSTIAGARPLIAVEYGSVGYASFGLQQSALRDWAHARDYSVTDLFGLPLDDEAEYTACVDTFYWDFLLVPAENTPLLQRLQSNGRAILASFGRFSTRQGSDVKAL